MQSFMLLYIDPGTGSMLFTILIGLIGTAMFFFRKLVVKLRFWVSGGRAKVSEEITPYVIFSDSKNYWNTFKPICDEFESRGIEVHYLTASPDDPALNETYEHVGCRFIGEGNKAFACLNTMHADICLSTTPGLDVYQWKRSKSIRYYVHVMHSAATAMLYRMFGIDYYDAVLVTGSVMVDEIRELESVRKDPEKELRVVGCPYLDALKNRLDRSDMAVRASESGSDGGKTILLAPSWGESAILALYGEKILDALVKTGYRIIIRPHPQSMRSEKSMIDKLMKEYPSGEYLEWDFEADNFDSLNRADLMITDFSAVILDFALVFDKPVIYAEYELDRSVYDAFWIDHPLWQELAFPKLGAPLKEEQFEDIRSIIDEMIGSDTFAAGRKQVRDEAWMHIGESAKRVVDFMVEISADKEK